MQFTKLNLSSYSQWVYKNHNSFQVRVCNEWVGKSKTIVGPFVIQRIGPWGFGVKNASGVLAHWCHSSCFYLTIKEHLVANV